MNDSTSERAAPLSVLDAVMLIVGIVIGSGIFALPPMVAANTGTVERFALAWLAGGLVSLAGALCYAELATTYPNAGGEHHFLRRAFGGNIGFLFAWSRMTVLQTGSIAIQAYIIGDYLSRVLPLGDRSSAIYAAFTVIVITGVNLLGLRQGKRAQVVLGIVTCVGVLTVAAAGLFGPPNGAAVGTVASGTQMPAFGLAMVFVLLTFGGWNEAAYVSADVSRKNMVRALMWGIGVVTIIYLVVNLAYVKALGMSGLAASTTPAADLMARVSPNLALMISGIIAIAALSTMNATTITGGRSNYALGQNVALFGALGRMDQSGKTPRNALIVQAAITLFLVFIGAMTRERFVALVEYTAPVFWFFFFLVGLSVFVLRWKDGDRLRPFRIPLYPITPIVFCGVCLYMIRSSVAYTGVGALVGVAVLIAGVPMLWLARARVASTPVLKQKEIIP